MSKEMLFLEELNKGEISLPEGTEELVIRVKSLPCILNIRETKGWCGFWYDLSFRTEGYRLGHNLFLLRNEEEILDMNYHAVHTGKRTESAITASGALAGSSQKVFRGTIDFIRGCAGAVGNENEDVLILDDGAINKTVPLILCEEEDVEGNHGASIGRPDEETLFYLMSRGISREEALAVLRRSKLCGAVMKISDEEFRKELLESIYDRT